jgi:Fructose-bisphosphate aldolase class-I
MERCFEAIEEVLHAVFHALHRHKVILEYMVLKPSMVLPGKERPPNSTPEQIAGATVKMLRRAVPDPGMGESRGNDLAAQQAFSRRAKKNDRARSGRWNAAMEESA